MGALQLMLADRVGPNTVDFLQPLLSPARRKGFVIISAFYFSMPYIYAGAKRSSAATNFNALFELIDAAHRSLRHDYHYAMTPPRVTKVYVSPCRRGARRQARRAARYGLSGFGTARMSNARQSRGRLARRRH